MAYSSPTLPFKAQDEAGFHWSTRTGFLQNGDESFAHFPLIASLSGEFFSLDFFFRLFLYTFSLDFFSIHFL
jgi:hypothetical protein